MRKNSTLLLLILLCSSSLIVSGPAYALTAKPAAPEFTLKYADYSYYVPPTYGVDPYTGKSVTLTQGHEVVNRTVIFTIKNEPFTPHTDSNGTAVNLYYHVRYKGSYESAWSGNAQEVNERTTIYDTLVFPASNTAYTDLSVVRYSDGGSDYEPLNYVALPDGGSVDFQVQAITGAASLETLKTTWSNVGPFYAITGQLGDWSSTQTVTIGENNSSTTTSLPLSPSLSPQESQNPSSTQAVPQTAVASGNDWTQLAIVALLGVIAVLLTLTVALQLKKRKQQDIVLEKEK